MPLFNSYLGHEGSLIGSVFYFAAMDPPKGFLVCDGSLISKEIYADLYAVIGTQFNRNGDASTHFRLPDLTNLFIRGHVNGRAFGSYQSDENKSHSHTLTLSMRTGGIHGGRNGPHFSSEHIHHGNGRATTANSGGSEARPKNRNLLPIIAYE